MVYRLIRAQGLCATPDASISSTRPSFTRDTWVGRGCTTTIARRSLMRPDADVCRRTADPAEATHLSPPSVFSEGCFDALRRPQGLDARLVALRTCYATQSNAELVLQQSHLGDAEGLEALLWAQAPIDVQSDDGQTPLMLAVTASSHRCVALLLATGADVNAADASGTTALHLAAVIGDLSILRALCAVPGIDRNAQLRTVEALTPLQLARFVENHDVVAYLSEPGDAA